MPDFYQILEVSETASPIEIKRAYKRLAKKWHPDMNPGNPRAAQTMKQLNAAWETLGDPRLREGYDARRRTPGQQSERAARQAAEEQRQRETARREQAAREAEQRDAAEAVRQAAEQQQREKAAREEAARVERFREAIRRASQSARTKKAEEQPYRQDAMEGEKPRAAGSKSYPFETRLKATAWVGGFEALIYFAFHVISQNVKSAADSDLIVALIATACLSALVIYAVRLLFMLLDVMVGKLSDDDVIKAVHSEVIVRIFGLPSSSR